MSSPSSSSPGSSVQVVTTQNAAGGFDVTVLNNGAPVLPSAVGHPELDTHFSGDPPVASNVSASVAGTIAPLGYPVTRP